ncbi:MAG: hypothetical protein V4582_19890 [Pseudomonadota bacterium]
MKTRLALVTGVLLLPLPACAGIELGDSISIDGFGTVGMYRAQDGVAGYRADPTQDVYSRNSTRFDGDSQLSLQATLKPGGPLSGVVQLLSKRDVEGSLRPRVEWAYLSWDVQRDLNLKFGRTVAPIFLMSDYRNLNYAQTMVRPPSDAYVVNPITHQDGVSAAWKRRFSRGALLLEGFYGKTSVQFAQGTVDFSGLWGVAAKWTQGPFVLRAGQVQARLAVQAPAISAGVAAIASLPASYCSNCAGVGEITQLERSDVTIWTVGAVYERDDWLVHAEWMRHSGGSIAIGQVESAWLMGGYRMGAFTPYVSVSQYMTGTPNPALRAGPAAPPAVRAQLDYLNVSNLAAGNADRKSASLGLRWDVREKMALKFQFDHVRARAPQIGTNATMVVPTSLLGKASGFDGSIEVFTLNLDFAF